MVLLVGLITDHYLPVWNMLLAIQDGEYDVTERRERERGSILDFAAALVSAAKIDEMQSASTSVHSSFAKLVYSVLVDVQREQHVRIPTSLWFL